MRGAYMCSCSLRRTELPDGRRVSTIDLFSYYAAPSIFFEDDRSNWRQASDMCNSTGRYETVIGDDFDHKCRTRTWQQALAVHEALVANPAVHELSIAEYERREDEFVRLLRDAEEAAR